MLFTALLPISFLIAHGISTSSGFAFLFQTICFSIQVGALRGLSIFCESIEPGEGALYAAYMPAVFEGLIAVAQHSSLVRILVGNGLKIVAWRGGIKKPYVPLVTLFFALRR